MSNKWTQFLPIITATLEDDDAIRLEFDWSQSIDTDGIERGDSNMTLAEAEEVARRLDDWLNSQPVSVYIQPKATPGPLTARFSPEAWINDYAVPVDAEGEQEWQVSAALTEMTRAAVEDGDDLDFLVADAASPKWVREWSGPFTIKIVGDAEATRSDSEDEVE